MKKWIYRIIQIILICAILYSAFKIGVYVYDRVTAYQKYSAIEDEVNEIRGMPKEDSKKLKAPEKVIDYHKIMEKLKARNGDAVGYIDIQGTVTHYPIVQTSDNEYYLYRGMDEKYSVDGTPFMDYRNKSDYSDMNTIIYGHTMKNADDIFSPINYYYEQDYVDKSPKTFTITHENGVSYYRIFSVYLINETEEYRETDMYEDDWIEFLNNSRARSAAEFGYDKEFDGESKIVTLSTCTKHSSSDRTVMVGVLEYTLNDENPNPPKND